MANNGYECFLKFFFLIRSDLVVVVTTLSKADLKVDFCLLQTLFVGVHFLAAFFEEVESVLSQYADLGIHVLLVFDRIIK